MRGAWMLGLIGAASVAGLAFAQPASPPLITSPPPAPVAPAPDEAPPATTGAPAPVVTPPMQATEVAPATPPPSAAKPAGPPRRARFDVAVIEALDKVTAESLRFEAEVGKPVRYKSLVFTVRACERSMSDEPVEDSIAYMTVDSQPRPSPGKPAPPARQAFKGWMYASSPGLHPLEHPVYDAWLISCRAKAPATPTSPAAPKR
jgi:hypothetical protein